MADWAKVHHIDASATPATPATPTASAITNTASNSAVPESINISQTGHLKLENNKNICTYTSTKVTQQDDPSTVPTALYLLCSTILSFKSTHHNTVKGSKWFGSKLVYDAYSYLLVIERQTNKKQNVGRPRYFGLGGSLEDIRIDALDPNDHPKRVCGESEKEEVKEKAMVRGGVCGGWCLWDAQGVEGVCCEFRHIIPWWEEWL